MEITITMLEDTWFKTYNLQKTTHPAIHRFYLRWFGKVTALSESTMLWNVSLFYTKVYLHVYFPNLREYRSQSNVAYIFFMVPLTFPNKWRK